VSAEDDLERRRLRRVDARRRQTRRRRIAAASVAGAALLLVVLIVVLSSGGGEGTKHARKASAGRAEPAAAQHRPAPPVAARERRATDAVLAYTDYLRKGGNRVKDMALTFDDGPGPDTPRILAILRRYRVPATFFVMGRSVSTGGGARTLRELGGPRYPIGDHTLTHPPLGSLGEAAQRNEILGMARLLREHGKPTPTLFRPPFGSFNATTRRIAHHARMLMVLWTADTKDYSMPGKKKIIYTAVSAAEPGAIVLMHDGPANRSQTVAALPRIIVRLRQRGYKLVTIPQMLAENPPPRGQPEPPSLSGGG
jgi:peptidoglycan-N-acetylglucosamine deacetylase